MAKLALSTATDAQQPLLSLEVAPSTTPVSDDVADKRVEKGQYALPDKADQIQQSIQSNQEQQLRESLASDRNYQNVQRRNLAIQEFARAKGGPLTPQDMDSLKNFINVPSVSPDSVLEQSFSEKYLDVLRNTPGVPGSWFEDAQKEIPEQVEQIHQDSSVYLTKINMATTARENAEASMSDQSWVGWGLDQAKYLVPFYQDYKLRGQIEGVSRFYGLLGTNLEEQAKELLRKPMPEFTATFGAIMKKLTSDNPSAAVTFARAIEGQSLDEQFINNVFNLADIAALKGLGIGKLATSIGKQAMLAWDVRRMYKEAIKASPAVEKEAANVVVPAVAGDVETAAINKSTNQVVANLKGQGEPVKDAIDGLSSVLQANEKKLVEAPESISKDFTNRLLENAVTFRNNLMNVISNLARVERLPAIAKVKDAFTAIKDDFLYDYRGPSNSVLDVQGLTHNPVTNTYTVEFRIGRTSGTLFATLEEARNFAKNYGFTIKGSLSPEQIKYKGELEQLIKDASNDLTKLAEQRRTASLHPTLGIREPVALTHHLDEFGKVETMPEKLERTVTPTSFKLEKELSTRIKTLEDSIASAQSELQGLRGSETGVVIVPHGRGYWMSMTKPLDETKTVIRDAIVKLNSNQAPDGWFNAFFGWLRTPDETLSFEQTANRKVASYANTVLLKVAKEEAESIRKLARFTFPGTEKKARFLDWERAVKFSREDIDPNTQQKGYFKSSVGELDAYWRQNFGRGVTEAEANAYFSFSRLVEMDAVLREMTLYKNMSRLGIEEHMMSLATNEGEKVTSPWFKAKTLRALPGGSEDTIAFFGGKLGEETATAMSSMPPQSRKRLEEQVKKGEYKVLELYDPEQRPLEGYGKIADERIRYIVVPNNTESRPLGFSNLPRRGGGHFDFDYDHYIKQARVRFDKASKQFWYEGDNTLMPLPNRAMGHDLVEKLEVVREKLKAKDIDGAKEAAKKLGISWDEVYGWFRSKMNTSTGKFEPARFNLDEPFKVVPRNKMINDIDDIRSRYVRKDKSGREIDMFQDGTRSGSLARQFQVEYTGQRDVWELFSPKNEGTAMNPVYKYEPARMLDPIPSLNRGLNRIINSTFMDDYKIFSSEHWLKSAEKWLKEDWKNAPFYYFNRANEYYKPGIPAALKSQLELQRFQIQQFTGIASKTQALLDGLAQDLADATYKRTSKTNQELGELTKKFTGITLTPANMVAHLTDPAKFMHFVTYNAIIGLWSIPQILVQSMTYVTIMGIAGASKAGPGAMAAFMHQMSRLNKNPAILAELDKHMSSFFMPGMSRWRPGEFLEAMDELKKTGFDNVAGTHSFSDHPYSAGVIKNGTAQFLDAGTIFFRGAERNVRYGAWYTAYREFRDLHPTGAITQTQRNEILNRADLLAGNMSRASKSTMQMGALSFPTQFLSYQLRLAEQLMGHRLTQVEKARLLGTYSALYGIPVAMGALGFPFTDIMRQSALENGYVVGDNFIESLATEGFIASLGKLITGHTYDVGQRLGGPGMDIIREGLAGDKPWYTILGGASGTLLEGALKATDGFRKFILSHMDPKSPDFPLTLNNFIDPFKQISSVNNASKLITALNVGRWYSRNESYLADVTPEGALLRFFTGLQTQQEADLTRVTWSLKDRKELQDAGEKEFIKYIRRGLISLENNNPDQAKQEFTQAKAYLILVDYPREKYDQAYSLAFKDKEDLVKRLNWDFHFKDVPESQKPTMVNARQRMLQQ